MESSSGKERRKGGQRRHVDSGPPSGVAERRINIERRLFNLGIDCDGDWGAFASAKGKGQASSGI